MALGAALDNSLCFFLLPEEYLTDRLLLMLVYDVVLVQCKK